MNSLTGKATLEQNYAPRTRRHTRAAIRSFYQYHRQMRGPLLINPFPQAKGADDGSHNAHHNPMQLFRQPPRRAAYQPKEPRLAPRSIPDEAFNELFSPKPSASAQISGSMRANLQVRSMPQGPRKSVIVIKVGFDYGSINKAWLARSLTAATPLAILKLVALYGDLARAEPSSLRYPRPARLRPPSAR